MCLAIVTSQQYALFMTPSWSSENCFSRFLEEIKALFFFRISEMPRVTYEQREEKPQVAGSEGFSPANTSSRLASPLRAGGKPFSFIESHCSSPLEGILRKEGTSPSLKEREKKERSFARNFPMVRTVFYWQLYPINPIVFLAGYFSVLNKFPFFLSENWDNCEIIISMDEGLCLGADYLTFEGGYGQFQKKYPAESLRRKKFLQGNI